MTPTQRTLARLKENGYKAGIVERYIAARRIRIDLFNIIDIIAIRKEEIKWDKDYETWIKIDGGVIGVQSTGSAFSEHWKKLTIDKAEESRAWLESGARLQLWGWRKVKVKRGGKAIKWEPRIKEITIGDLEKGNQ